MPGLELELTQRMRLAPASVAVLSVLSLPQGDLDEFIAARVATNPLLERGAPRRCRWCAAPAYGGRCAACGPGPVPAPGSDRAWIETLRADARAAVPTRLGGAVNAVVDHLDPRGLLDAGVDEIADAAGRSPAEIAVALAAGQSLPTTMLRPLDERGQCRHGWRSP
jgi:RNA polymerase sigma-54 factor